MSILTFPDVPTELWYTGLNRINIPWIPKYTALQTPTYPDQGIAC
jgi:hypothetical protein